MIDGGGEPELPLAEGLPAVAQGLPGANGRRAPSPELASHARVVRGILTAMDLGRFSVSLAVKDLARSRAFYQTLGFEQVAGVPEQNWIILQNGDAKIGLFQGMFEGNLLTFNPSDARAIQKVVTAAGYALEKASEDGEGPTHFVLKDPDGNVILVDQHE